MIQSAFVLVWKSKTDESLPLSGGAKELLGALRYKYSVSKVSSYGAANCPSEQATDFCISNVVLSRDYTAKKQHTYRISQSLTRLRSLLNEAGKSDSLAISINSLSLATTIFMHVMKQPSRNDSTLRFGRSYLNPGFTWLLYGNDVYDIATNEEIERMYFKFRQVFLFMGVSPDEWGSREPHELETTCNIALMRTMKALDVSGLRTHLQRQLFDVIGIRPSIDDRAVLRQLSLEDDERHEGNYAGLHSYLSTITACAFPGSRLYAYGSCRTGLSNANADIDLSLDIPRQVSPGCSPVLITKIGKPDREFAMTVLEQVQQKLQDHSNSNILSLCTTMNARVPVVKGSFATGQAGAPHLEFDITVNNDLAVLNSDLLLQYSLIDVRFKWLMKTVKRWAKAEGISSTKDQHLSSYGWTNLVIFYLQCCGFVPNLQSNELLKLSGTETQDGSLCHRIDDLDTTFLTREQVSEVWEMPLVLKDASRAQLLKGFFNFYTTIYPTSLYSISIRQGYPAKRKGGLVTEFLSIEDPFETFDSPCPHDLGRHVDSAGSLRIAEKLHRARTKLANLPIYSTA